MKVKGACMHEKSVPSVRINLFNSYYTVLHYQNVSPFAYIVVSSDRAFVLHILFY